MLAMPSFSSSSPLELGGSVEAAADCLDSLDQGLAAIAVGALAQSGAMQVVGSINQNITTLEKNPETQEAAGAFRQLSAEIQSSDKIPSERERKRYLEDIEELTAQAAKPKPARETGVTGPIIDRLAALCGGAGGLATVWQVVGPSIIALFRNLLKGAPKRRTRNNADEQS